MSEPFYQFANTLTELSTRSRNGSIAVKGLAAKFRAVKAELEQTALAATYDAKIKAVGTSIDTSAADLLAASTAYTAVLSDLDEQLAADPTDEALRSFKKQATRHLADITRSLERANAMQAALVGPIATTPTNVASVKDKATACIEAVKDL